ncbi:MULTISPECIES: DUF1801 domain-containing protein [unclassified Enterococcus]|uniref:DUF1801 domain-containing protein n=1 Tax=unclassified Enterococcus TaxID=2608891 RepID=UPI001CE15E22|nr:MULTISPECIES: DUF1801 domain-containing protein [unclassified Enterococcus]MCA5012010.1 DUF1801 domain-containing protein [Enterococcus sp. S23]MCA5015261.1 DUF1801 domain-containing protein [Enterococcus sp. S22(2020)]
MKEIKNKQVAAVFEQYPEVIRLSLLELRALIFEVGEATSGVGEIEESLKWHQPTYSTIQTKSGTPIRLDRFGETKVALFFHCQTTVIEEFRALFSKELEFSKNRAIVLDPAKELPLDELAFCIQRALTYHQK